MSQPRRIRLAALAGVLSVALALGALWSRRALRSAPGPAEADARPALRITEFSYNAETGEFIELTNLGATPIALAGWSLDDIEGEVGAFDLGPAKRVAPGESIVVTTTSARSFRAAWGLSDVKVLGPNDRAKLSREDTIHLFGPGGVLVDRLTFGDQVYEGTVRTHNATAYVTEGAVGACDPYGWRGSEVGDSQGSWASSEGDIGSPGRFALAPGAPLELGERLRIRKTDACGRLHAFGSLFAARNVFELRARKAPPGALGYAVASLAPRAPTAPLSLAAHANRGGFACAGPASVLLRATARRANEAGEWSAPVDLSARAPALGFDREPALVGSTWFFQVGLRDPGQPSEACFTDALRVPFY